MLKGKWASYWLSKVDLYPSLNKVNNSICAKALYYNYYAEELLQSSVS